MIGKLDQRITLQSKTLTPDGGGGSTEAWGNLAADPTVWAAVKPMTGSEIMREGGDVAVAMYRFIIRNRSDLDERFRIVWEGSSYNIRQVQREGGRALYLTIIAERGVPT